MHNEMSFSLNGLDKRTRARLGVIALEMHRSPEELAEAILSEWSMAIIEGLAEPPLFSAKGQTIDFINCGLIEPPREAGKLIDVQTAFGRESRSSEDQIPLLCHTEN